MIDRNAASPLRAQIVAELRARIEGKTLKPGARLPSERELCEAFAVSRITVRNALAELTAAGLIQAVPGVGSFVAITPMKDEVRPLSSFTEDMAQRGLTASARILEGRVVPADRSQAALMGLSVGDELILLRRLRLVSPDDLPVAVQVSLLPFRRCPDLLDYDLEKRSLFEILRGEYGLRLTKGETTIAASLATPEEARLLGLPMPAAFLVTDQLTYIENDEVIEFAHSVFRSDLYRLTVVK